MKTFNMNSWVHLKLTPKGLEMFESLDDTQKKLYFRQLPDDEGYCVMQLFVAFNVLGQSCTETINHYTESAISAILFIDEKDLS
jgi:hypothetical protein